MAAFGISFPKLTLCRTTTPKADTNTISIATTPPPPLPPPPPPTTNTRTLSLSIKNVPSQPLHYDVSTTTVKKKTSSIATILAIDGETKQLPKNLSVFNELQLDDEAGDINEKRRRAENSSDVIVPSSLSPMGTIDHRPDIRFLANIDSKKVLHDFKDEDEPSIQERRSNHTFTPPTSSLSHSSSFSDLQLTSSSLSVDLPQLKYAIEKFLVDDDPVYQIAQEFSSGCSLFHDDHNDNAHSLNVTKSDLKHQQHDKIDNTEFRPLYEKNTNEDISSRLPPMSDSLKWYVSELRINRPLIYRTQWTNGQHRSSSRQFSHSVNDLKQIYNITHPQENGKTRKKTDDIAYSTLSLQNLNNQEREFHPQSDDYILLNSHLSYTDDDLNNLYSDDDDQHFSPLVIRRTLDRSLGKDDTLIRNESVKKKLFDILNDGELENACLEDMSQEFDKLSLTDHHRDLPILNSFSSSSDDALYSSPPNELHFPLPPSPPPPLSSSYNENLSANLNNTTERYFGRSRLITTSLDKIPMNNNASDYSSSTCLLRPSYEHTRPSWYTSPSPQWRMDDQLSMASVLKRHSSNNDDHLNGIDPNRFLSTKMTEYDVKENKYIQKCNHRKEKKHVSYSLLNTSTPLLDNSPTIRPIIQDKPSNLLMFI